MSEHDLSAERSNGEIDPAHLAEVTRAALPYLGPYSITAVKRASKNCHSIDVLCEMVASQITEGDKRQRFTEVAARLVHKLTDPAGYALAMAASAANSGDIKSTGGRPPTPVTPELRARGEKALAHIIGPLARVLVARYATSAENSRQFFDLLAGHIRNPEEREVFFDVIRGDE